MKLKEYKSPSLEVLILQLENAVLLTNSGATEQQDPFNGNGAPARNPLYV